MDDDDEDGDGGGGESGGVLRKCAYCDLHTPLDTLVGVECAEGVSGEEALRLAKKMRMKRARKMLAERRMAPPQLCMPVVPEERVPAIMQCLIESAEPCEMEPNKAFFDRLKVHNFITQIISSSFHVKKMEKQNIFSFCYYLCFRPGLAHLYYIKNNSSKV